MDITELFIDASAHMTPSDLLLMENYNLNDAMSAFEIGEVRLDSGMPTTHPMDFIPAESLLPDELCWLIDITFAYEMAHHKGHFLAHSIYNLLHLHCLDHINPELIPLSHASSDPRKPLEYVTLVLRSLIMGLLKTTDYVWRELNKMAVFDAEDWQSDKCEVSLLEGTPVAYIEHSLDDATDWVLTSGKVPDIWTQPLTARLVLRKTILQLVTQSVFRNASQYPAFLNTARSCISTIRSSTPSFSFMGDPSPDSPARKAVQNSIARQLSTFTPFVNVDVPTSEESWTLIEKLLDGYDEIISLSNTHSFSTWEIVGTLRLQTGKLPFDTAFRRSLTQTTFYDNILILSTHPFSWLTDRFFLETLGVGWGDIVPQIRAFLSERGETNNEHFEASVKGVERVCAQLLRSHIRALFCNPPRRRRQFMKSVLQWQNLIECLDDVGKFVDPHNTIPLLLHISLPALIYRLQSILYEIVLSGFPLALYGESGVGEEGCLSYWYAWKLSEVLNGCFRGRPTKGGNEVKGILDLDLGDDVRVRDEWEYQMKLVRTLGKLAEGCFQLTGSVAHPIHDLSGAQKRFTRRYKWAFRPEYEDFFSQPVGQPGFWRWVKDLEEVNTLDGDKLKGNIAHCFIDAQDSVDDILLCLEQGKVGWTGVWSVNRIDFIRELRQTIRNLSTNIGDDSLWRDGDKFDWTKLQWGKKCPSGVARGDGSWFPRVDGV